MSDMIEQLRALSAYEHDDASIGEEAAAEIERLTAKVADLEAEIQRIVRENKQDWASIW